MSFNLSDHMGVESSFSCLTGKWSQVYTVISDGMQDWVYTVNAFPVKEA